MFNALSLTIRHWLKKGSIQEELLILHITVNKSSMFDDDALKIPMQYNIL